MDNEDCGEESPCVVGEPVGIYVRVRTLHHILISKSRCGLDSCECVDCNGSSWQQRWAVYSYGHWQRPCAFVTVIWRVCSFKWQVSQLLRQWTASPVFLLVVCIMHLRLMIAGRTSVPLNKQLRGTLQHGFTWWRRPVNNSHVLISDFHCHQRSQVSTAISFNSQKTFSSQME